MTLVVRLLTLLTIAAAGFAMPMTCAQTGSAHRAETAMIDIPAVRPLSGHDAGTVIHAEAAQALTARLLERVPLDCRDKAIPRASDQLMVFDTQPFVPGYLGMSRLLGEHRGTAIALPPLLIPIDTRAGPPDAPPPESND